MSKQPCIKCDSSDGMEVYPKGDAYCFSCHTFFRPDQVEAGTPPWEDVRKDVPKKVQASGPLELSRPADVPSRGLDRKTLEHFGVGVEFSETNGEVESLVFPVYRKGDRVGEKIKTLATKTFSAKGSTKSPDLFGSWKCREGGKLLIITEGEEDCMSVHQLLRQQGKDYNVVSLPNGANAAAVKNNLEWLETFETVVLNLDNDQVGQDCAREIGDILTPGKVKIMALPTKDANDFLLAKHNGREYLQLLGQAKTYRPDGIVNLADSWDLMWADESQHSIPYPWDGLNKKLYGMREREIVTWTAGTGIGKSAVTREIEHHLLRNTTDNIGILALEESVGRTSWGLVSVEANLPLAIREERASVSKEDVRQWFDATVGSGRVHTFDHWGSTSERDLISRVRFMIKGLGCKWVILDHLSIVVSAMDDMGDERKAIDAIMTKLRSLVEQTGAGMHLVCHLRRIDGNKGHEQGMEVSLAHLRGSQAIAQLSDAVVAMERNQQADDEREANLTKLRVLKNRYAGLTGLATSLAYDRTTGRLKEITNVDEYLAPPISEAGC